MTSSWGNSWGTFWGNSWGSLVNIIVGSKKGFAETFTKLAYRCMTQQSTLAATSALSKTFVETQQLSHLALTSLSSSDNRTSTSVARAEAYSQYFARAAQNQTVSVSDSNSLITRAQESKIPTSVDNQTNVAQSRGQNE